MTTITNPYDALYTNLKNRFTVIHEGCECTLGDYMLIKAGKRQTSESSLAITTTASHESKLSTIVSYVSDKLTVKNAPEKNKTIRRFPLRTSMSSIFSAVAACALVFSFGILALTGGPTVVPRTVDASEIETRVPEYDEDTTEDEIVIEK